MTKRRKSQLPSEQIILESPMSYTGAARRAWRWRRRSIVLLPFSLLELLARWVLVTVWYVVFGILVVPYRLVRRGRKQRQIAELRHREALAAQGRS